MLIIAQAWLLADAIAAALNEGKSVAALSLPLGALLLVVLARGALAWGRALVADRSSVLA